MKLRYNTLYMIFCGMSVGAMLLTGCFSFNQEEAEAPLGTDPAIGNFCHGLSHDGGDLDIRLQFEKDDKTATLSAVTGSCTTSLDAGCDEIPTGDDVILRVNVHNTPLLAATVDIAPGGEYEFYLSKDTDLLPVLRSRELTEINLTCANSECNTLMYTPATCAAADPCGWVNDGYCDDLCQDVTALPFDDTADCSAPTDK